MALWSIFRKLTAPATPEQDALYFVADPNDTTLTDLIVSGDPGNVRKVKGVTNVLEVQALIDAKEVTAGAGLVKVGNEIRLAIGALPIAG